MSAVVLLACLLAPQEVGPQSSMLSGTVVNSISGEPLPKVQLALEPAGQPTRPAAFAWSGPDGAFLFPEIAPGQYHLKAERNGFLETYYGSRRSEGTGITLRIEAGQKLEALRLKMMPFAVVAGVIRDSDGEPLRGAEVRIIRVSYIADPPELRLTAHTQTDDLGQYRLVDLAPGRYYLRASPKSNPAEAANYLIDASRRPEVLVPTLYPGVLDAASAVPLEIGAGARLTGIDIVLARARLFRIRGRVFGIGRDQANLQLTRGTDQHTRDWLGLNRQASAKNADGEFEFLDVPPGAYRLTASTTVGTEHPRFITAGSVPVSLAGLDLDDVRVTVSRGAEIVARTILESQKFSKEDQVDVFFTGPTSLSGNLALEASITWGYFSPGRYEVRVESSRYYARSIRSGDIDVMKDGLLVSGPYTVPLEIVLAPALGLASGIVVDKDGKAAEGATVVASRDSKPRSNAGLSRWTVTDQYGRYELTGLAPGDYKLYAWEDVEPDAWRDPGFLKKFEEQAQSVQIRSSGNASAKLSLIPALP